MATRTTKTQTTGAEDGTRLGRVPARLAKLVEIALVPLDLSPSQYRLLCLLPERNAEGASVLARAAAISQPTLTAVVDGLLERGLVERRRDATDGRRIALRLSRRGRTVLASADAAVAALFAEVAGQLSPPKARRALASLDLWHEALDAYRAFHRQTREKQ